MVCLCCRGSCAREFSEGSQVCGAAQEKCHYVGLAGARSLAGCSETGRAEQTCSREHRQGKLCPEEGRAWVTEPLGFECSSEHFPLDFSLAVWQLGSNRACSALEAEIVQGLRLFPSARALPGKQSKLCPSLSSTSAGEPGGCTSCCPENPLCRGETARDVPALKDELLD